LIKQTPNGDEKMRPATYKLYKEAVKKEWNKENHSLNFDNMEDNDWNSRQLNLEIEYCFLSFQSPKWCVKVLSPMWFKLTA
jgi:hypothetical protein